MDTLNAFRALLRQVFRLHAMHLDATERYPLVWAAVLGGAGLGLVWGIAARIWMRLISTRPEFTISGTAAILVIAMVFGACTGFAFAARRRGWRRWGHYLPRVLVVAFFVPFGGFAGAPLMLTVLLATLAVTQTAVFGAWATAVRTILLLLAAIGFGAVSWQVVTDKPGWMSPVYVLLYFILLYPLFLALRVGLEPCASARSREATQANPVLRRLGEGES